MIFTNTRERMETLPEASKSENFKQKKLADFFVQSLIK